MTNKTSRVATVAMATSAMLAGTGLTLSGTAWAHNPPGTANDPKLVKFTAGAAEVGYSNLRNAPGSPQPNALRFDTTGAGTSAQVRSQNIGVLGDALGDVDELSLKARHSGNPQLVLQLDDGRWLHFYAGDNCSGGVDFSSGWYRYNFSTSDSCEVVATGGGQPAQTYASYAATVTGEGAGSTVGKARVTQNNEDGTAWVDDVRLGTVLFAGPTVDSHSH
jgi:hypothetical protein